MQVRIMETVTQLRKDPTHPSLHVHKVTHSAGILEARIDKKNRLTFYWDGPKIVVQNHCNHDILDKR
jgi:hypothetical protein